MGKNFRNYIFGYLSLLIFNTVLPGINIFGQKLVIMLLIKLEIQLIT